MCFLQCSNVVNANTHIDTYYCVCEGRNLPRMEMIKGVVEIL